MTVALHGFLGTPQDWNVLPNAHAVDLWADQPRPFWDWASQFNRNHSGTLVGYSMGGRLALHALIDTPSNWQRAVIVSAHPGLPFEKRSARLKEDALWADKFTTLPWEQLMDEWNSRPVFKHDAALPRKEEDYARSRLAESLTGWSLGHQEQLHTSISELPMPITWIVGERDTTYVAEAKSLRFAHPDSKLIIVPNQGHRIPFKQIGTFVNVP